MITSYQLAVEYLYANLPMFQRVGASAYKKDLTNTIQLCQALDDPQNKFKSIHVAGTNGKGSTSHMLASILQEAGYKTGLYTSPHLKEFTERIRVNGQQVRQDFVLEFVNRVTPLIERIKPSFFEITVAMAFDYFAREKVDVAVIEVGLGGRLDSTNVITPLVSVITNIGWDHKDILGDTLTKIAYEKAGIIKKDVPVVVSERQPDVMEVFIEKAKACNSQLNFASDEYSAVWNDNRISAQRLDKIVLDNLQLPLGGFYQAKNLPGVLKTVEVLRSLGFKVNDDAIFKALERVVINTGLKGRWQKLQDKPLVVCDTGHNIDGFREIVKQINATTYKELHMVIGVVKDKEVGEVLAILPKDARYYFCQAKLPRALDAQVLLENAREFSLQGEVIRDVNTAVKTAIKNAANDDFVFVGGSTFVVAEIEGL